MNPHKDTHADHASAPRARRRWKIAAALAVAVGVVSTSFASGPLMHGHHGAGPMSPAAMQAHIDSMVEQCATDASPDQRARLTAVANAFVTDVRPMHEQFRQSHAQAHALLMAPVVDRMALERWRAEQMQRMDAMSRRALAAVEDGADVLTPEQRARCASRLGSLMH
jgi:protein CpxP